MATELDIIRSLAAGEMQSPHDCRGAWFAALMVSPAGARFDSEAGYYIFRYPEIWLSQHMRDRIVGVPVLGGADPGPLQAMSSVDDALGAWEWPSSRTTSFGPSAALQMILRSA